jgi:putative transcriptional regulator
VSKRFHKGQFLVARPDLADPNFGRSVVYLFEHTEEGAAGVVINRPSKLTIEELSEKIYPSRIGWDKPIHIGGPVGGPLLVVHQDADWADEEIDSEIYRTVDPDKIRHILERKIEPSLLVANYAGWGPKQLEFEIGENAWDVVDAEPRYVFWNELKDLWDVLTAQSHVRTLNRMLKIRDTPGDPTIN